MPDRLIANASPLIFLSRVGGLGWLSGLCPPFVGVPRGVMGEISAGHDGQYIIPVTHGFSAAMYASRTR